MHALARLDEALTVKGLTRLGGFDLESGEEVLPQSGCRGGALVLIGNEGRSLWEVSGAEIEALKARGLADPLDHWTRATLAPIARAVGATAFYPFTGPPYAPFTRWATRTGALHQSPLGLTIHPDYGLWHAFRAAFHFADLTLGETAPIASPCDSCAEKPCLSACPVGAFTGEAFEAGRCRGHLADPAVDCWLKGCLARMACPVGKNWRYSSRQTRFHMAAFRPR